MKVFVVTEVFVENWKEVCVVAGVYSEEEKAKQAIEEFKQDRIDACLGGAEMVEEGEWEHAKYYILEFYVDDIREQAHDRLTEDIDMFADEEQV